MSHETPLPLGAEVLLCSRTQHEQYRYARYCRPAEVEEHLTRKRIASEAGRSRVWPSPDDADGPHREGEEPKPMMHGRGKSDAAVVAVKPANKTERSVAESVEPRAATKGNAGQQSTRRAQNRISVYLRWLAYGERLPLDPRWEPYAGKPHVRICAGGAR